MRGYAPFEASSGPETRAGSNLTSFAWRLVLPRKSGLCVLKDLRKRSSTREIPVMLLSGQINLVESGHAYDAEAAFHKPRDFQRS
jgi:DNA-binding response OmpR family regulator